MKFNTLNPKLGVNFSSDFHSNKGLNFSSEAKNGSIFENQDKVKSVLKSTSIILAYNLYFKIIMEH